MGHGAQHWDRGPGIGAWGLASGHGVGSAGLKGKTAGGAGQRTGAEVHPQGSPLCTPSQGCLRDTLRGPRAMPMHASPRGRKGWEFLLEPTNQPSPSLPLPKGGKVLGCPLTCRPSSSQGTSLPQLHAEEWRDLGNSPCARPLPRGDSQGSGEEGGVAALSWGEGPPEPGCLPAQDLCGGTAPRPQL